MFKKSIILLLCSVMLLLVASCASSKQTNMAETVDVAAVADGSAGENLSNGKPWIDSQVDGGLKEGMEFRLQDDFAAANNKDWQLQAQFVPGYSFCGGLYDIAIKTYAQLSQLVTGTNESNDPDLAKVQAFYGLFMDWDARNRLGVSPLMPTLEKMESIATIADLDSYLVNDSPKDSSSMVPFAFNVDIDVNDSTRYTLNIGSTPLLLGDSAEYSNLTEYGAILKEVKLDLAKKMLIKVGYSEARTQEIIDNCMAFETAIAPSIFTSNEKHYPDYQSKSNNPVTRRELEEMQGNVPLVAIMLAIGIDDAAFTDANVQSPEWLETLRGLYVEENVAEIRDYLILHYVTDNASSLDKECFDWTQTVSNALTGIEESMPMEQIGSFYASAKLNWTLAKVYCNRYVTEEDKERIRQLCEALKSEYKKMLEEEEFLSPSTKAYAVEKVDAIVIHSLYPDEGEWPDYSSLTFKTASEGGSFFEADKAIKEFSNKRNFALLGTKKDRTKWNEDILPSRMNASNYPVENAIYVLSGICQDIAYNSSMTDEELYATMGTTIGHEISHSFDSSGAQYDKNGNLSSWWQEEDYNIFLQKNQKMVDFYNKISPWEGQYVHGEIITGEVSADMAGMKVILRLAKKIPNFDYDKFFRTYASFWRAKFTKQGELDKILHDEHPLNYLRINVTTAQFDEFQKTYGIQPGDGMYIAPEDRVIIW